MNEQEKNTKTYRLEEMLESMEESIKNLNVVRIQQASLIDLVEQHDEGHIFDEFITESKEQLKNLDEQFKKMNAKYNGLKVIVEKCKKSEKFAKDLTQFIDVIGLFND